MDKLLAEGYRAASGEGLALTKEFEKVNLEGWDDEALRIHLEL